jgi:5'-3' exonuclease
MGIPAFFANIIKNYIKIVQSHSTHKKWGTQFNSIYMDCNSIIYDTYYRLKTTSLPNTIINTIDFEQLLIQETINKIKYYIKITEPTDTVYITFDGVAPLAKMEQQRTRRYKSIFLEGISFNNTEDIKEKKTIAEKWSTINITPGTQFMERLNRMIYIEFNYTEKKYGVNKIIVSCADNPGEGEHKIFHHLRTNLQPEENVIVYGLDADLIMLSIFHSNLCKNIYVFREAPEFVKSKIKTNTNDDNELLFMDINYLSSCLLNEMGCKYKSSNQIYDFVFMCFLLGNDFLPHFPSINLRNNGMEILMSYYRKHIGSNSDKSFISPTTGKIQWKYLHDFIKEIAKDEHKLILNEYSHRERIEHYKYPQTTPSEKEQLMNNTPILYRGEEKYICPTEQYWEERYYKILMKMQRDEQSIKQISNNYIEGLEWVFKYYTEGCPNWLWEYKYSYPPLLTDLVKYIPHFNTDYFQEYNLQLNTPFHHNTQLLYVIPSKHHNLIDKEFLQKIKNSGYYDYFDNCDNLIFKWAFCRYLWESHIELKEVSLDILVNVNNIAKNMLLPQENIQAKINTNKNVRKSKKLQV